MMKTLHSTLNLLVRKTVIGYLEMYNVRKSIVKLKDGMGALQERLKNIVKLRVQIIRRNVESHLESPLMYHLHTQVQV